MLRSGGNLVILLKSEHHLHAKFSHQIRVLAVDLLITAPALVPPHVENGRIDIGVTEQSSLASRDVSHAADQLAVPGMPQSELGRKIGRPISFDTANAFVGEVRRNAQPGLFDKESLHLIERPGVLGSRPKIRAFINGNAPSTKPIEVFVDRTDPVLPEFGFPFGRRQVVLKHAQIAIKRYHLAGFFIERHLRKQVFDAIFHVRRRIFVDIHPAVLVKVYVGSVRHFLRESSHTETNRT